LFKLQKKFGVFPKPKFGDIIKDYGFAEDANPQYRKY
jgi:hypothetical protein